MNRATSMEIFPSKINAEIAVLHEGENSEASHAANSKAVPLCLAFLRSRFSSASSRKPVCVFSSDPAVRSSIFVGAEGEKNLIRNDPDKSEFTIEWIKIQRVFVGRCVLVDSGNPGHLVVDKQLTAW